MNVETHHRNVREKTTAPKQNLRLGRKLMDELFKQRRSYNSYVINICFFSHSGRYIWDNIY